MNLDVRKLRSVIVRPHDVMRPHQLPFTMLSSRSGRRVVWIRSHNRPQIVMIANMADRYSLGVNRSCILGACVSALPFPLLQVRRVRPAEVQVRGRGRCLHAEPARVCGNGP